MTKTYGVDPNRPEGTRDPKLGDDDIRKLAAAVVELLGIDHYMGSDSGAGSGYDDDDAGKHSRVQFREAQSAAPTLGASDVGSLYVKQVNTNGELHFEDEAGSEVQITEAKISGSSFLDLDNGRLTNNTYLKSVNEAGDDSVDLIKAGRNEADDADVAVLPDTARTASNAAPGEDTNLANKKYVDDQVSGNIPVGAAHGSVDSDGNALIKEHVYQAQTAGFVTVLIPYPVGYAIYMGNSDPPATKMVESWASTGSSVESLTLFVPKDYYFKITETSNSGTPTIYWTPLISGGGAPRDID
ncbi:MAG TPA: hypothetical protein HPP87_10560 [Planctomycetes bacterium]|nr:hypothetical protein [Planctomycetota bacterium]